MTSPTVRVRFAPSPTGKPHLGNLRTAIVNWLFARHHGGAFVVRTEDTDAERSRIDYEADQFAALRWLGLDWDEGSDIGGPYGPYRQSERRAIYGAALATLFELNKAYYCFCSESMLSTERRRANSLGVPYVYSRRCRQLDPAEARELMNRGEPATIRFDIHGHDTIVHDLIKGDIRFQGELLGDFVIVRADGTPTYNFVAAVDDHAMGITHVLRGEDHLSNTPRQIAIQEVLGHDSPAYGHLPLLLGSGGAKMSKREGAFSLMGYQRKGLLPEAIGNALALLGWSPADVAAGEVFTLPELVPLYDLDRVSHSAAHFQREKLDWFNAQHLRRATPDRLLAAFRAYALARHPDKPLPPSLRSPRPGYDTILRALQPSFGTMREALRDYRAVARRPLPARVLALLGDPVEAAAMKVWQQAKAEIPDWGTLPVEDVAQRLKAWQKRLKEVEGIPAPVVYHTLRALLTGLPQGPELKIVIHLLDPIELRARLDIQP